MVRRYSRHSTHTLYIDGNCNALIELWNTKSKRKQKRWLNNNWIQFHFFFVLLLLLKIIVAAAARTQRSHCHENNSECEWMKTAVNYERIPFHPTAMALDSAILAWIQRRALGTTECGGASQPNHWYCEYFVTCELMWRWCSMLSRKGCRQMQSMVVIYWFRLFYDFILAVIINTYYYFHFNFYLFSCFVFADKSICILAVNLIVIY